MKKYRVTTTGSAYDWERIVEAASYSAALQIGAAELMKQADVKKKLHADKSLTVTIAFIGVEA